MHIGKNILLGLAFLLLGLEHFTARVPAWLTGLVLIILAVWTLFY